MIETREALASLDAILASRNRRRVRRPQRSVDRAPSRRRIDPDGAEVDRALTESPRAPPRTASSRGCTATTAEAPRPPSRAASRCARCRPTSICCAPPRGPSSPRRADNSARRPCDERALGGSFQPLRRAAPMSRAASSESNARLSPRSTKRAPGALSSTVRRKPCSLATAATMLKPARIPGPRRRARHDRSDGRCLPVLWRHAAAAVAHRDRRSAVRRSAAISTRPPFGVNLIALSTRFEIASRSRSSSPRTSVGRGAAMAMATPLLCASGS